MSMDRAVPPDEPIRCQVNEANNVPMVPTKRRTDATLYEEVCQAQRQSPEYAATQARWPRLRDRQEPIRFHWKMILRDEYKAHGGLIRHMKEGHRALWGTLYKKVLVFYFNIKSYSAERVEMKAVWYVKTRTMLHFLESLCLRWGYPERIITDNGPTFRANMWERFLEKNGIEEYVTPVYHQRSHRQINIKRQKLLRIHLRDKPQDRWDENLRDVQFALHSRANAAIGMTPSEALLGASLVRSGEWKYPEQQKQEVYARKLFPGDPPMRFNVCDRVLVRSFPGLRPVFGAPWSVPFPIVAVRSDEVYEVDRNGSQVLIHVDDIRPAHPQRAEQWNFPKTVSAPLEEASDERVAEPCVLPGDRAPSGHGNLNLSRRANPRNVQSYEMNHNPLPV
ncbi:hypothetical protein NQ315_017223, partial [Exocentrus adspersus]